MWSIIRDLNAAGTTVLLTTHYLDEAQQLADSVTILDQGRIAIEGTMSDVLAAIPARISFTAQADAPALDELRSRVFGAVTHVPAPGAHEDSIGPVELRSITIQTPQLQEDMAAVVDWARAHSLALDQLRCAPASLEEVFFEMGTAAATGKAS